MPEFGVFRGRGGGLHKFALPLPPAFAAQEARGLLTRVSGEEAPSAPASAAPPAPAVEQPSEPVQGSGSLERPARSDPKADWVAYAAKVSDRPADVLDEMTKAELVAEFGG